MGKRAIRERIFLILFRVDYYRPEEMPDQITHFFEGEEESYIEEERLKAEEEERELGEIVLPARITGGRDRIREKTMQIVEHLQELDKALDERMEGWNLKRIGKVELTILRLALFEMRYDDEVSDAVAINEAVELAKKFGGDESPSFVNGVLAKLV